MVLLPLRKVAGHAYDGKILSWATPEADAIVFLWANCFCRKTIKHEYIYKETLEKTEWVIKNEQSRDTGNLQNKIQNDDTQYKIHQTES